MNFFPKAKSIRKRKGESLISEPNNIDRKYKLIRWVKVRTLKISLGMSLLKTGMSEQSSGVHVSFSQNLLSRHWWLSFLVKWNIFGTGSQNFRGKNGLYICSNFTPSCKWFLGPNTWLENVTEAFQATEDGHLTNRIYF